MEDANIIENEEELELRRIENVSEDRILYSVEKEIGGYSQGMPTKILARALKVENDDVCIEIDIPMDEFSFKDKKFTFFRVSYNLKQKFPISSKEKHKFLKNLNEYFKSLFKEEEVSEQEQKGLEGDGFNFTSIFKNCIDSSGNPVDVNKIFTELSEEEVDVKDIKVKLADVIFLKIKHKLMGNNEIKLSFVDEDKKYFLELGTSQTKINNEKKDYFMKISNKLSLNELQSFIRKDKYEQLKIELMSIEHKKKQAEFSEINKKYEEMLIEYKKKQAELSEQIKFFSKNTKEMKLITDAAEGNLKEHNEKINFFVKEAEECKDFLITMINDFKGNANNLNSTSKAKLIIERAQEVLNNNKNNLNKNMNSELNKLKENVKNLKTEKEILKNKADSLSKLNKELKRQIKEKVAEIDKLKKALEEKELKKVIKDKKKFNELVPEVEQPSIATENNKNNDNSCCGLCCCYSGSVGEENVNLT